MKERAEVQNAFRARMAARAGARPARSLGERVATWLGVVALLVGGAYTGVSHLERKDEARIAVARDYVSSYYTAPLREHRTRLDQVLDPKAGDIFEKQRQGNEVLQGYLAATFRSESLDAHVKELATFFDAVRTCICASQCDAKTLREYLQEDAYLIHGVAFPFVAEERRRLNLPSFAVSMERFAKARGTDSEFVKQLCTP